MDHPGGAKLTHLLSSKAKKQGYVAAMASGAKACDAVGGAWLGRSGGGHRGRGAGEGV